MEILLILKLALAILTAIGRGRSIDVICLNVLIGQRIKD